MSRVAGIPIFLIFLTFLFARLSAEKLDVLLLHTNDMHGKFEEITSKANTCNEIEKNRTCVGGFARLAHQIRKYRKWGSENGRKILFLNAGDTFVGSDWYSVHKWKICADFLNILKPDVVTLGNHEFDDGLDVVKQFVKSLECPIVTSNIDVEQVEPVKKSTILEIDGRKIGIVGYLTRETAYLPNTDVLNITDEIAAVQAETEKLNNEGVKIIIALGHSGFNIDKKIAEECELIDIVIGGHSNTFLWNGNKSYEEDVQGPYPTVVTQKNGKKVPVVQAYAYTLYLGRLNATFDEKGDLVEFSGQPEYMSSDIEQDEDVLQLLEKYRPGILAVNREIVGKSSVYLDGMCRIQECNFGNLVTDAMVFYSAYQNRNDENSWANAAVALYNAGNLRNSINVTYTEGNITKGELLAALPFENQVVSIKLKGSKLLETLEHTVENYENNFINAQFLQVSGLRIVYDLSRKQGERVVSVKVRCSACTIPKYDKLDPDADYNVLTTDFILNGGDGFDIVKQSARDVVKYEMSIFELMLWYLQKKSPVYPEVDGRIKFLNASGGSAGIFPNFWLITIVLFIVCRNI